VELIKIAVMGLNEGKQLQKQCLDAGAEIVLNHNDETCNRGCSVTVEVHCKESDLEIVQNIFSKNYMDLLDGHDVDLKILNETFDPSKETAICPACGFSFSTKDSECPDCGLMF